MLTSVYICPRTHLNLKYLCQMSSIFEVGRYKEAVYLKHLSRLTYSTEEKKSEKLRRFREIEGTYEKLLDLASLKDDEKEIHFRHKQAVANGHFTYDDPVSGERILTRLRHFLKGKCCGKSCRHCIYEHSSVADEEKKARARFNSSFWVYDDSDNETSTDGDHDVLSYGRGPYPKKYAKNAPTSLIRVYSSPASDP